MKLTKVGEAGTTESGDIFVTAAPNDGQGVQVQLTGKSVVLKQFGRQIKELLKAAAEAAGVEDTTISAQDNGALDSTITARVRTAIQRAL